MSLALARARVLALAAARALTRAATDQAGLDDAFFEAHDGLVPVDSVFERIGEPCTSSHPNPDPNPSPSPSDFGVVPQPQDT